MTGKVRIRGFDFHCHVDLHSDPVALIKRCEKDCITVLAVTTTPKAYAQNQVWTKDSNYVHTAVGLHPELVGDRYSEIDLLEEQIRDCAFVGEVGLDGSPQYRSNYEKQKEVFTRTLEVSQKYGGRIMSIHSRGAAKDVISLIEKCVDTENVKTILHWFSGSHEDTRRAIDIGCYFSVNSVMLKTENGRRLLRIIPRERLLTETDSPFVKLQGSISGPQEVVHTMVGLADLYGESINVLKDQITKNAHGIFMCAGIEIY